MDVNLTEFNPIEEICAGIVLLPADRKGASGTITFSGGSLKANDFSAAAHER